MTRSDHIADMLEVMADAGIHLSIQEMRSLSATLRTRRLEPEVAASIASPRAAAPFEFRKIIPGSPVQGRDY